jgi:ribosomal protein S18 acetylase RimI-like enzyme
MTPPPPTDTATIQVRRLTANEVDDFRTIRLAALKTEPDAFGSVYDVEATRPDSMFAERLNTAIVFGAYHDSRIVGMIGLRKQSGPKDAHKAMVWGFFVEPSARRLGVGSALLVRLIDTAGHIVEQLTLSAIRQNTSAISLYEKHGFVAYGLEPRALKTPSGYFDEVLMVRLSKPL